MYKLWTPLKIVLHLIRKQHKGNF